MSVSSWLTWEESSLALFFLGCESIKDAFAGSGGPASGSLFFGDAELSVRQQSSWQEDASSLRLFCTLVSALSLLTGSLSLSTRSSWAL